MTPKTKNTPNKTKKTPTKTKNNQNGSNKNGSNKKQVNKKKPKRPLNPFFLARIKALKENKPFFMYQGIKDKVPQKYVQFLMGTAKIKSYKKA